MTDELEEFRERADKLLHEGYPEALNSTADLASMEHVAPKLGLDPANWDDKREFRKLAQYLANKGLIESYADGFGLFRITREGRARVEGEEQQARQSFTFYGAAYGIFGSQQHFRFEQVIQDLDRQIEEHGGDDKEELGEMVQELRETLENQDSITRSKFEKWSELANKHMPWLLGPLGTLLINYVFGAPADR